jgi:hypothetical protein
MIMFIIKTHLVWWVFEIFYTIFIHICVITVVLTF